MLTTEQIVDGKYLTLCPAAEAVQWLKEKRASIEDLKSLMGKDYSHQEGVLAARNDPYIDFGLARYGTSDKACRAVYMRGDLAIRCTFLAYFPNGGFAIIFRAFELSDQLPREMDELRALVSNTTLDDEIFISCFEKKGLFEPLNEEEYQDILAHIASNVRLMTPYDEKYLDGYSDYRYHKVFDTAWALAGTAPTNARWASVLYHLLYRCLPPHGFDAANAIKRWYFSPRSEDEKRDAGFYLRSRLADCLKADDNLLKSKDAALRESFYSRFDPRAYPKWPQFTADTEHFLDRAMYNPNLWRTPELRDALRELAWVHPDPNSNMDMPNTYNFAYEHMKQKYPQWFVEES
jgi:hypothetical protein